MIKTLIENGLQEPHSNHSILEHIKYDRFYHSIGIDEFGRLHSSIKNEWQFSNRDLNQYQSYFYNIEYCNEFYIEESYLGKDEQDFIRES